MSPSEGFWAQMSENQELIDRASEWAGSKLPNNPTFICKLIDPKGTTLLGLLDIYNDGTGVLRIPLKSANNTGDTRYVFMNFAAASNQISLNTHKGFSASSEFKKIGLKFATRYESTYCNVTTNSGQRSGGSLNYFYITIGTQKSERRENISIEDLQLPSSQIAVGVEKDITDTLPGFRLAPLNLEEFL